MIISSVKIAANEVRAELLEARARGVKRTIHCKACGSEGHNKRKCPLVVASADNLCGLCRQPGHKSASCLLQHLTSRPTYQAIPCERCRCKVKYRSTKRCVICALFAARRASLMARVSNRHRPKPRSRVGDPEQRKETYAKNWALRLVEGARERAKERGWSKPDITPDWVRAQFAEQKGCCFYLKSPLRIPTRKERRVGGLPWQPSLDRIDNDRGYFKDNVRLTSWFWNHSRGAGSIENALLWCSETLDEAKTVTAD